MLLNSIQWAHVQRTLKFFRLIIFLWRGWLRGAQINKPVLFTLFSLHCCFVPLVCNKIKERNFKLALFNFVAYFKFKFAFRAKTGFNWFQLQIWTISIKIYQWKSRRFYANLSCLKSFFFFTSVQFSFLLLLKLFRPCQSAMKCTGEQI